MREGEVFPLNEAQKVFLKKVLGLCDAGKFALPRDAYQEARYTLLYGFYTKNNRVYFQTMRDVYLNTQ